ncbi:MAG: hypothetical protein JWO74_2537 [Solirubrobacterales bacterium]|nr:hypothetical protein [Solirubrobacterales bacterium]
MRHSPRNHPPVLLHVEVRRHRLTLSTGHRRLSGGRIGEIGRALTLVLVAAALVCPSASARSLALATPVTVVGPAVGDGQRWVAWTQIVGRFQVVDAKDATQRTLEQPGCHADAISFGRLLANCVSPESGPRVLNLATGATYAPPPGQPPYISGFDPSSDSFSDLGRYWLIGSRTSSDPHVHGHTIYLNFRDGHTSQADGLRDLDSPGLDRLHGGRCPALSGPTPRSRLVFGAPGARHALRVMSCATGKSKVISNCARWCYPLDGSLNSDVLVWLEGRTAIHAIRPATGDQHAWLLPRPASQAPPYVRAALAANRLFVSIPAPEPTGPPAGASTPPPCRAADPQHARTPCSVPRLAPGGGLRPPRELFPVYLPSLAGDVRRARRGRPSPSGWRSQGRSGRAARRSLAGTLREGHGHLVVGVRLARGTVRCRLVRGGIEHPFGPAPGEPDEPVQGAADPPVQHLGVNEAPAVRLARLRPAVDFQAEHT